MEFALNQSQRNTNSLATSCLRLWLLTAAHTQIQRKGETDSINDVLSLSSAFSWVKQHAICSESSRDSNSDDSISLFRANLLAMSLLVLSDLVCMKQAAVEVAAVLPVWVDATESLVSGSLTRQEEAPSVASILVPVLCRLTCILAALSSSQQESKPQIKTPKHFFSEADFTRVVSSLGRIMSAVSDATEGLSVVLPTVTASMVQKSIQHLERASLIYATQLDDDIDEVV